MTQDEVERLSGKELQDLMGTIVHVYAERVQEAIDDGEPIHPPMRSDGRASVTDMMITARRMLEEFNISAFELSMLR